MAPDLSRFFAERGFAMVSIDYRLSDESVFPAPIEDVKTAVRWIRSVADTFALDSDHVCLWGSSAGGHLAACAALSSAEQFQGSEHLSYSSAVQAVVDGYGPVDFSLIDKDRGQFTSAAVDVEGIVVPDLLPAGHPESFESRFLGVPVHSSPAGEAGESGHICAEGRSSISDTARVVGPPDPLAAEPPSLRGPAGGRE